MVGAALVAEFGGRAPDISATGPLAGSASVGGPFSLASEPLEPTTALDVFASGSMAVALSDCAGLSVVWRSVRLWVQTLKYLRI